jgi:hypothetical protein
LIFQGKFFSRNTEIGQNHHLGKRVAFVVGSSGATLFITVLFRPQSTENYRYQRVIKDQAAPDEAEAALMSISHNQASSWNHL